MDSRFMSHAWHVFSLYENRLRTITLLPAHAPTGRSHTMSRPVAAKGRFSVSAFECNCCDSGAFSVDNHTHQREKPVLGPPSYNNSNIIIIVIIVTTTVL